MLIESKDGRLKGDHSEFFPNTSFPSSGPTDSWLDTRGFLRVPKSKDEMAAEIRADRNSRLAATDWRFRSDLAPSKAWADYCQALRDITAQETFPHSVVWPSEPE